MERKETEQKVPGVIEKLKGMRKILGEFELFCLEYNLEWTKNLLGFRKMTELMTEAEIFSLNLCILFSFQ